MRRRSWGLALCALSFAASAANPAPPSLADILRPHSHDLFTVSPDGRYIAATARVDGRMMLAIVNRETLKAERVIDPDERGDIARMAWVGPERLYMMNSRVGYRVEQAYLEPYVIAMNVDGSDKRTLTQSILDTLIDDDEHILVEKCARPSSKGCWPYVEKVRSRDGRGGQRVAEAPAINASFLADNAGRVHFAWALDDADVHRLWLRRGEEWALLNDESTSGIETGPIGFSRDGRFGFLLSERKAGPNVIERVELATGAREVVLSDPLLDPEFLVWSADGREPIGAAFGLHIPRARFWDSSHPDARLVRQLEAAYPDDIVRIESGSRDGRHVVVRVSGDRDPGSYYLFDRTRMRAALVARAQPWVGPDQLSPARPVRFNARDGLELTGYLTLPIAPAGERPPLVVLPHGGPFGVRDSWDYDEETQILAAHGYAVLRVNFRGSAGFGRAFTELGYRQWGARMQDDLTDATRWALASGEVDPSRACIWGTSYGGYAALMGAALEPDLYRCAISTAGPTDLNLMWKWGDTQRSRWGRGYLEQVMGRDGKALLAASPIAHAGTLRPALMLAHGLHDQRVAFQHARDMRAALEKAGKPYVGYFPTDETHGVYGDDNRHRYYTQVLDFLATHLGGRRAAVAAKAR